LTRFTSSCVILSEPVASFNSAIISASSSLESLFLSCLSTCVITDRERLKESGRETWRTLDVAASRLVKKTPGGWAETLAKKRTAMHAYVHIFTCTHQRFDATLRRFVIDVLGNHCLNSNCVHYVKRWKWSNTGAKNGGGMAQDLVATRPWSICRSCLCHP
jgi:hypothetical protein